MKPLYLLIIFFLFSSNQGITKSNFNDSNKADSSTRANSLIKLWEQSNSKDRNVNDPYAINVWEKLLSKEFEIALKNKDDEMQFRLSIPLSYTYHSETKFSKGKPLLEYLLLHKERLSQKDYDLVLIKLEEEYRAFNDLENAIKIRKERISNHFINNYWEIYKDCGLYEAAKKDLFQFVTIPPIHSLKRLSYYFLLGDLYFQMKSYDSASAIYSKGLTETQESINYNKVYRIYKSEDLKYWEACFNGYIIKCNIEKGDYSNAIPTLLYDIAHSYQNTDNIITKLLILTKCYLHDGRFNEAKRNIETIKKMLFGKLNNSLQLELLLQESNYFNAIQKNDSALYFYKLYNSYRDELYRNTQKKQSILLLGQLEITNRRNELMESKQSLNDSIKENSNQKMMLVILLFSLFISILFGIFFYRNNLLKSKSKDQIEAKNILINEHLRKMEAQSNHNEVLLKELHHRVKNNLQVMYSLLNLQKRRNGDTDTVETLSSIQNRIQTMALVHQTLYTSGNFELVEVASYIKTLANHLESIYKIDKQKISVKFVIDELLKLPIETVVAIGLIVNEAVSNAFKYAFKNKSTGKLTIKIIETESEISIIIEDNGNGFLDTPKKENSLGMRLIDLMCSQLKAKHTIEMNKGVRHLINFNK
jgi:two-component sensor histidine kinase